MSAAAELKRDLLDLQGQYDKLVPLHQGQSGALQVLLTGTVRNLQKQLHHPTAYI